MNKVLFAIKLIATFSILGLVLSFGLLEYHYTYDPYSWLDPSSETVTSRNLWNERKWQYFYFGVTSLGSLLLAITTLSFYWFNNRRTKLR